MGKNGVRHENRHLGKDSMVVTRHLKERDSFRGEIERVVDYLKGVEVNV